MPRHWSNAYTATCYGEVPADDIYAVAGQIMGLIEAEGLSLDSDVCLNGIGSAIVGYIAKRSTGTHALEINVRPRRRAHIPEGWTPEDEQVWREWIGHQFTLDEWQRKVMYPVFGTNRQIWEEQCEGWRGEIHTFLHLWIQRRWEIMDTIDPRQLQSAEEVQEAERAEAARRKRLGLRVKDVDPYLAEQEERRGKGRY